jgi:hypothetical protein
MQTIHSHLPAMILAGTLAVVLIMWWVPKFQARYSQGVNADNRFDRENNARKTLAQIIGGVFVLAGLYSSIKTFDLQRQSARLQEEGQITDRFSKAIDQLGALSGSALDRNGKPTINLEMRLGGIYALERIASDSPRDYWTIMEVLMTYVRENAPASQSAQPLRTAQRTDERASHAHEAAGHGAAGSDPAADAQHPRTDIQAILTVIGRRDAALDPPNRHLDLSHADLAGASLRDVNLQSALLMNSNLESTNLMDANLKGADLEDASLAGASLVDTNLQGAVLQGADLKGADLSGADISGAILSEDQLKDALGDTDTKLPSSVHRPASWTH